ncbi:hypothetical protein QBC37DRAFT_301780, partial [Rhypophila decipiens]
MAAHTPKTEYSPRKRQAIVDMYKRGYKYKTIAALEDCNSNLIASLVARHDARIKARSLPRSGRPPLLNMRDLRHVFRLIEEDPFISSEKLVKYAGLTCSPVTLTRALKQHGIQ